MLDPAKNQRVPVNLPFIASSVALADESTLQASDLLGGISQEWRSAMKIQEFQAFSVKRQPHHWRFRIFLHLFAIADQG